MKTLLLVDTETTGLDPAIDSIIEVGAVLWSVEHRCVLSAWSDLTCVDHNEAEAINHIPVGALSHGDVLANTIANLRFYAGRADVIIAHRVEFDRGFLEAAGFKAERWCCSKFDIEWPASKLGDSLVMTALAHGVAVTHAHRALTDCMTLAHIFEAVANRGHDVTAMLEKALRPRVLVQALVSYDDREKAKTAGFSWDGATKRWTRRMLPEDVHALAFRTVEVRP
jgi:DNA polymerase-3 subunit epsilon